MIWGGKDDCRSPSIELLVYSALKTCSYSFLKTLLILSNVLKLTGVGSSGFTKANTDLQDLCATKIKFYTLSAELWTCPTFLNDPSRFVCLDIHTKLCSSICVSMYSGMKARACANDFATKAVNLLTDKQKENEGKDFQMWQVDNQLKNILLNLSNHSKQLWYFERITITVFHAWISGSICQM